MSESEPTPASEAKKHCVFIGLAMVLLVMAVYYSPSIEELLTGWYIILTHPSKLDFDGLAHPGNFGSAFLNAGSMLLAILLVYKLTKTKVEGPQIAAALIVVGFGFYGKNLLNIWFPVAGVFIHAVMQKKPLSSVTALAFFATAIAPSFSVIAFGHTGITGFTWHGYLLGTVFGVFSGVLVSMLSAYLPKIHQGYTLFNAGYAAGLVGIFYFVLLHKFDLGYYAFPYDYYYDFVSGENAVLGPALFIIFAYLIIIGFVMGGGAGIREMVKYRSKGGNYVDKFGFAPVLINMGIMGIIPTAYVFLVGGCLNGPLFACILTAVGFAANGVTLRSLLPTMAGVFIAAFLGGAFTGLLDGSGVLETALASVSSRGVMVSMVFSCGLAAIPGAHGTWAGIFVGFMHGILVPNTGAWHGWMSLYNNGLSLSIVATFLLPIYTRWGVEKEQV